MRVELEQTLYPFRVPFRIAYRVRSHAETVVVHLSDAGHVGRGEALGVSYHGETAQSIASQLEAALCNVVNRHEAHAVASALPPGGARNALDCALWDLRAKQTGRRAWAIAGLTAVRPLLTAYTLCLDTPEEMARGAEGAAAWPLLKLKLGAAQDDIRRVASVRRQRPDARIIVDANQAWTLAELSEFAPEMARFGVELIEQPLPIGADEPLRTYAGPIPLCADESCQSVRSLPDLVGKYTYVNIKLDKTGGLSEALLVARQAQVMGFRTMVGCMGGSSLSMAPAFIVGQYCALADLDGPALLQSDMPNGMSYTAGVLQPPTPELWG